VKYDRHAVGQDDDQQEAPASSRMTVIDAADICEVCGRVSYAPLSQHYTDCVTVVYKGAITSKIKHAIKHKTTKQVPQDLHKCCTTVASSRGRYAVIGCKLKQNANEGCNSCASLAGLVLCFIACFILLVIAP